MRSTRREVFTSLLVAPALAGIAAAGFAKSETLEANKTPNNKTPEQEIIEISKRFIELEKQVDLVHEGIETFEEEEAKTPELQALYAEEEILWRRAAAIKATTLKMFTAKAKMFAAFDRGDLLSKTEGQYWDHQMLGTLINDLINLEPEEAVFGFCPTLTS